MTTRRCQQLVKIVRWVPTGRHFPKHPIRIIITFIGAFGVRVVNPSQDENFAGCVVAKKQQILLEKLGPEPVFVFFPKGVALSVFGMRRVSKTSPEGLTATSAHRFTELYGAQLHDGLFQRQFSQIA